MRLIKIYPRVFILAGIILCLSSQIAFAGPYWYELYKAGCNDMKQGSWESAIAKFQEAIKIEPQDDSKKRVGVMRTEYFPHRETGVCFYNLGDMENAREELSISLRQSSSKKAKEYLGFVNSKLSGDDQPVATYKPLIKDSVKVKKKKPVKQEFQLIGDRLSIAVLPFETKGVGRDLGDIDLMDKLITELHHLNRFLVIERSQLEKILQEHKLNLSGIIDQSTAVEVGKTAGVDVVVLGSITCGNQVSIDARLVDTETANILTSRDAFSKDYALLNLSKMINDLARKINSDMPIIDGLVIKSDAGDIWVDIAAGNGLKKNMKCHVYREGEPVIHPVSGDTIDIQKDQICGVQVTEVFDGYSIVKIIEHLKGSPRVGDKAQTK